MPKERRIKGTPYYFLIVLSYHFSAGVFDEHYGLFPDSENDFDYGIVPCLCGSQLKIPERSYISFFLADQRFFCGRHNLWKS